MPNPDNNLIDKVKRLEREIDNLKLLLEDLRDAYNNIINSHKVTK